MACIIRECDMCGYADTSYPSAKSRCDCPVCGGELMVSFDEEGDHEDREGAEE